MRYTNLRLLLAIRRNNQRAEREPRRREAARHGILTTTSPHPHFQLTAYITTTSLPTHPPTYTPQDDLLIFARDIGAVEGGRIKYLLHTRLADIRKRGSDGRLLLPDTKAHSSGENEPK